MRTLSYNDSTALTRELEQAARTLRYLAAAINPPARVTPAELFRLADTLETTTMALATDARLMLDAAYGIHGGPSPPFFCPRPSAPARETAQGGTPAGRG